MTESIIIFLAKYLYLIVIGITFLFILFSPKKVRLQFILLTILSLLVAFMVGRVLSIFIINPRPFVEGNFLPLVSHIPNNGFPSEHALLVFTLALSVYYVNKKVGILLLILGVLVGVGRILTGVHHILDILGSIIISIFVVSSVYLFLKRCIAKNNPSGIS